MSPDTHLVVDAMGGDFGPRLSVPASLAFLQQYPDSRITLIGDSALIQSELKGLACTRLSVDHAPDAVAGGDKPSYALRHRQESSLWRSLELLQQGRADACVSGGNTGAIMAIGKHLLGTLEGIERPAICKPVPSKHGCTFVLDLGANLNCTADHLIQFAHMGACLARVHGISSPRVALLNVGAEEAKGSSVIQQAAGRLGNLLGAQYVGFVEGDGFFGDRADVIVCDGFAGNVALKVSEGAARLLFSSLNRRLKQGLRVRLAAWLARDQFAAWQEAFSPSKYNGAAFLGLQKPVIKSHGAADQAGFCRALAAAREQVQSSLTERLVAELNTLSCHSR